MSGAHGQHDPARLTLALGRCCLTVEQCDRLAPGDIVPLDAAVDADVRVQADGRDVAAGRLMQCGGKLAVKVACRLDTQEGGEHV